MKSCCREVRHHEYEVFLPRSHRAPGRSEYPAKVAQAVELLLRNGVGGPYGIALGRDQYTKVIQTTEKGGYLLAEHLKRILGGPLVWAPE